MEKIVLDNGIAEYILDPAKKETTPGIYVSAGEITDDFDKVSWKELLEDYTNMRNGGAVESTSVSILKYPIVRAGYTIEHENQGLSNYVEWCFKNLVDSFGETNGYWEFINHLLLALDYGCSFFEKVYKYGVYTDEGKITNIIERLAPFKPETIWEFHYNSQMRFSGIRHERREQDTVNKLVDIPVEKLFFYSHSAEFGDPRGKSELRPARNLYKIKKDIILSTARAQQRGAGIPELKSKKNGITAEEKTKLETLGRSIGNMKNGYVITDETVDLIMHSLQIQGSPEKMLEFINREMFFNTLSEFMTSGLGQNGSRSATSEHKSSYELKCGTIVSAIESRLNKLIREMVDISYFGPQKKYPEYKVNAFQMMDIIAVAESIGSLYEKNVLLKQDGDEQYIRSMFGLPDVKPGGVSIAPVIKAPLPIAGEAIHKHKLKTLSFTKVLSAEEQMDFVHKRFDVQGTEDLYMKTKEQAKSIVQDIISKYLTYIAKRAQDKKPVEMKYNTELTNKLQKLYRVAYDKGYTAVNKEIDNCKGKELSTGIDDTAMVAVSQSIRRFSDRLLFGVMTVAEDMLDSSWVPDKESAIDFLKSTELFDGFKIDRLTLIEKTLDGYTVGRKDALVEHKNEIELYYYNSILDGNLCDICAGYTGAVMTAKEVDEEGFLTGAGRVNPSCQGGDKCRCNLMVYELKGGFDA